MAKNYPGQWTGQVPAAGPGYKPTQGGWRTKSNHTDEHGRKSPAKSKIAKVMREYKGGKLHSGSKHGPKVKSRSQAVAIAMSENRRGKK